MSVATETHARFVLPEGSDATDPPEHRGLARDGVRLLTAGPEGVRHGRFHDLPGLLDPGDLVVVNTSPTLPAALAGTDQARGTVTVHVSAALDDATWVVEVRRDDGSGPDLDRPDGERLRLPGGVVLTLGRGYPTHGPHSRLRASAVSPPTSLAPYLAEHGRPVTYGYLRGTYPLSDYQTVYATDPVWGNGSAEMASAGRPFTDALLTRLMAHGVAVAPVELHAGVSSPELHEPPSPERFVVPEATAALVRGTRAAGRRVVAVGTTVVRALEAATGPDGVTRADCGWTDLVLSRERGVRAVSGLVTGLHAPEASHLLLLEAVAGTDLVARAYEAAVAERYRWHEFGDSMLFLP
ncbi:MAG TPA: S-adenosylmethionine:tRNA ribosyltransferase-isomerase [Actinomycetales bacterium]|nr:S-adenosylmethionine:tRNA ribosyltransferase-isomerase [Actinomycetales bacterium]